MYCMRTYLEVAHLVVFKNDLVASELGATVAPDPKARYVRFTFARWSRVAVAEAGAGGGSFLGEAGADIIRL